MEISSEKEDVGVKFEIEMSDEEKRIFLDYAAEHITPEEHDELLIEWAMIKILKEKCNEVLDEKRT